MMSPRPHRCKRLIAVHPAGQAYLAYFEDELPIDVNPLVLIEDGYTRIIAGFRYTVKELKDGTFIILRDIVKEDCQIAPKQKGEGLGNQPATFDYIAIPHYCNDPSPEDEEAL